VPSPVVLHLTRPYANADEYLAREAWSIDTRSMVLVGQPALPAETDIAFDVMLADGSKPIRAEAKVVGPVAPAEGRPGGLRVRFKRYGSATRAFVERAVSLRSSAGDAPGATPEPPIAQPRPSTPPPPVAAPAPASVAPPASVPSPPASPSERPSSVMPAWDEDKTQRFTRAIALAMPMTHEPTPEVAPPANRDALLDRLRKRAKDGDGSSD
jgi:hypothetical protein